MSENVENSDLQPGTEPRSINKLIDLPYSEMTDEEIEIVIEFKAAVRARDAIYSQEMQAIKDSLEETSAMHLALAQSIEQTLADMTKHAIERYESES